MFVDRIVPFIGLSVKRSGTLNRRQLRAWGRDKDLREATSALLLEKYEAEETLIQGLGEEEEESGLIRFFKWLIDNQDSVKAFIEMIMSLFATSETISFQKENKIEATNTNVL